MRSIPLLNADAAEVFDDIAAAKQQMRRRRMQASRPQVLAAYQGYEAIAPEVGGLAPTQLNDLQKQAMRHAYTVETEPMTALRGKLLQRTRVARCPFCSLNETSTLDHYLPKESYPEFSIFPENLVPSCAVCNTRKRDRILIEGTNVRMFLHPCYDAIPDVAFLDVRTRMREDALILSYRLIRPAGMQLQVFRRLQSHFDVLGLADRYRRMAFVHLGDLYPALRRAYGVGKSANRVADKLIEGAKDFEEANSMNHWLAKLYRALAGNMAFCDGGFEVVRVQTKPQ